MRIRFETKSGEIYFGDPYEVDFKNADYIWLEWPNKRRATRQELDKVMQALGKHCISLDDLVDWVALIVESPVGCHLTNVESHYENGVRVIDKFKIDSVSMVSEPIDEYCKLNLVKESEE